MAPGRRRRTDAVAAAEILAACPSAEWHVVELDSCATDMLAAVGDSLAWLAGHDLAKPVRAGAGT